MITSIILLLLIRRTKESIEQKRVKGIDVYADESLNDRGVITNEQLQILIEDHTEKKPGSKDSDTLQARLYVKPGI